MSFEKKDFYMSKKLTVYSGVISIVIPLLCLILILNFLPRHTGQVLARENGLIEFFSAVGYFIGTVIAVFIAVRLRWPTGFSVSLIMLLFGLRELDFNAKFTTMGISKIKFYLSPEVGVIEKSIVVFLVILLFTFLYKFLKKHTKDFIKSFKQGVSHTVTAAAGIICLPLSKFLDGGFQWLDEIGQGYRLVFFEESIELAIPYFFIFAMLQFYKSTSNEGIKEQSRYQG
jgi:MFS family permease